MDYDNKRKRDDVDDRSRGSGYPDRRGGSYSSSRSSYSGRSSTGGSYGRDDRYYNRDDRYDDRYISSGGSYRRDDRYYSGSGSGSSRDDRYHDYNRGRDDGYYGGGRGRDEPSPPHSSQQQQQQTQQQRYNQPIQPIKQEEIIIDQEKLQREREEEKKREQEKMEEEMLKRREKVEQWRKEKERQQQLEQEKLNGTPSNSQSTTSIATSSSSSFTMPSNITSTTEDKSKWSLEDEDEDISMVDKKQDPSAEGEEEEDPLDAFMNQLNKQQQKLTPITNIVTESQSNQIEKEKPKGTIVGQEDEELEQESEDEKEGKEIDVKKGKRELLTTDHSTIDYKPFEKDFYIEVPMLANMNEIEVKDYQSDLGIKITGKNCPKPVQTWSQCGLSDKIHLLLKKYNYEKPTPIQAQTIPAILSGRDIIGIARTGSGKTLAFLLPMIRHVMAQEKPKQGEGMVGLVMSPTRELALQIYEDCKKFSKALGLRVCCVYGGANIGDQIADLKRGADIVVCTPGRMIDILCANNKRITNLRRVTYVVLDEADRMFDLGFGPQIMCVIENTRPDRQTVMFSATFPFKVEQVARKILTKPLEIIAGGRSIVCSDVEQFVEVRPETTRVRRLLDLLSTWYHKGCILIFTNKQETTDNLYKQLEMSGYRCLSLHGNKDQTDRVETISDFKNKVKTILIATPLASRGLDVKDLNLVINFDCPDHLEDYVHRVGRTGRAGNKGTAYTFITPEDERFAPSIEKALEQSGAKIPEELKKLSTEYQKKRSEGKDVKIAGSGFAGRGHKFDAAEEEMKKEERKRQRRAYGIEDDEEDEAADNLAAAAAAAADNTPPINSPTLSSSTSGQPTASITSTSSLTTSTSPTTSISTSSSTTSTSNQPQVQLAMDPKLSAGQQALSQIFGGNVTMSAEEAIKAAQIAAATKPVRHNPNANLQMPPSQAAAALAVGINPIALQNSAVPIVINHQEELEINDYSQQARWKVTHKDSLLALTEMTHTAVTTKGTFFPPNKAVPIGEKKLYLLIEGPNEMQVKLAKAEIKKILDEVQLAPHTDTKGKYSVF